MPPSLWPQLDEDGVLYAAPFVVVGTVVDVQGPIWNTADGQKWTAILDPGDEDLDYTIPVLYREITVDVDRVARDDLGLGAESVSFVALGGGDATPADPDSYVGGHFEVGKAYVLFLGPDVLDMREGPIRVLMPFYQWRGVYPIEQGAVTYRDLDQGTPVVMVENFLSDVEQRRKVVDGTWEPYRITEEGVAARIDAAWEALRTGAIGPRGAGP